MTCTSRKLFLGLRGDACAPGGGTGRGALAQGPLLRDVHCALLRLMEGAEVDVREAPTLAGYGAAAELAPRDAYRCGCRLGFCSSCAPSISPSPAKPLSLRIFLLGYPAVPHHCYLQAPFPGGFGQGQACISDPTRPASYGICC